MSDIDLSPREVVPTAARGKKKPWFAYGVLALVLALGSVFVVKFLTSAIDYYCNVDEVGVKDGCDVNRNIRIQGVVENGTLDSTRQRFVVTFNGVSMPVQMSSNPTAALEECIPVVITGKVLEDADGQRSFAGKEVLVKHDNQYDAENKERVATADAEADACSQRG
ncbi:MAG: cytochrome c maturation protein CcmE [Actinomycetota bacterium]|nr:cytochrome c maturation protein CcmE [Actinomycetota bacterium]